MKRELIKLTKKKEKKIISEMKTKLLGAQRRISSNENLISGIKEREENNEENKI